MAVYTGGVFFGAGKNDYEETISWQTMIGYFFFSAIACMMTNLLPVSLVFPL